jgi:glutamyl-tRNA reductase
VAKRVATETAINERRVSIPSVAVSDFAKNIFERFDDKRIVVIGAGEMAEETLRYVIDEGGQHITVLNRSIERARLVADKFKGRALTWERLPEALVEADLIISTTGAEEPIVSLERFRQIAPQRFQRDLFILDLAVPRDFDPRISDQLNVYLYSLDDLGEACERNRQQRDQEMPRAMAIVAEETDRFMVGLHHRATGPVIKRVREGWQGWRDEEVQRLFNRLPMLDDRARDEIRQSFDRLMNKLLHPPLEALRDESRDGVPHGLIDAFKRLFNLKD